MSSVEDYFSAVASFSALVDRDAPKLMPQMERLFPICRSLTGSGVRDTLDIVGERIDLQRERVATGDQCFDWTVPREWNIRDAWIRTPSGARIANFRENNLHVLNYSIPVRKVVSLEELQQHLYSIPEFPEAVPYRASYYKDAWGFCISQAEREVLEDGDYEVVIDSTLEPGYLDYAQCRLGGREGREVFFSTYICHPSMANDQLSGIVLLVNLMELLATVPARRFSYRALFAPETMGVIAFLSRHHQELKARMYAGFVVTCVGDDGPYTYVRSKRRDTPADKAAEHVLRRLAKNRKVSVREFDPVGSDERQYCSPGLNLPVGSLMRSRYGEFKQYHTSMDNLTFVSEEGLGGSLAAYLRVIQTLEMNCRPMRTNPYCEPQLGKRGLYSSVVSANIEDYHVKILNLLSFADGAHDLIDIAERLDCAVWELAEPLQRLVEADLLTLDLSVPG